MRSKKTSPSTPRTRGPQSSNSDAPPSSAIQPPAVISQITEDGQIPVVARPLLVLDPNYGIPPPHQDDLLLEPMTAEQTTRYDRESLPTIPLPHGWIELVQPDGRKYYYQPNGRIVTDSNIKQPLVLQALMRALAKLDMRLNAQNMTLPQTTEVTFEVDIEQRPPAVRYYFVDHVQKTEFWLENTITESLQCPPVTSYTHLKYLFRQHYWTHIEFYPMHLTLPVEVEDELVAVLTRACINHMTSSLSTFPYNQEQCEEYLHLIGNIPDSDQAESYRNRILARLWSEIDRNLFDNLRGEDEDTPRLARIRRFF